MSEMLNDEIHSVLREGEWGVSDDNEGFYEPHEPHEPHEIINDGFGNSWRKCASDCHLEIVRPGKVQCDPSHCRVVRDSNKRTT